MVPLVHKGEDQPIMFLHQVHPASRLRVVTQVLYCIPAEQSGQSGEHSRSGFNV